MSTPIGEYALLGDTERAALVSRHGAVDWLCLPRFDSPACFASLLGTDEHGRWFLGPVEEATTTRTYRADSFVLDTVHETAGGRVRVTDLMPFGDGRSDLVRVVEGLEGEVEMDHEWVVRTAYGAVLPWVSRVRDAAGTPAIRAVAGPDMLVLRGTRLPEPADHRHRDRFTVGAGERLEFAMTWAPSWCEVPEALEIATRVEETVGHFESWAGRSRHRGPYREAVTRSLLVLRLLTDEVRGGIVAAPTTSLPEALGGSRNWDYRYCWLRDASLTLEALLGCGYLEETRLWRDWLVRAVAGDPADLQIMYAVDGSRDLPERELDHLPGYAGSRPVRVGNGAVDQQQSDVLGEVMIALDRARRLGVSESGQTWAVQRALVDDLADHWDQRDHGLWEIRGPAQHFTHSRVMVWAAFDRAVRAVEEDGHDGDVERWRVLRDRVHDEVCRRGYDAERNTFTQHYETHEVDAALLVIPAVGFLPPDDPRVLGTVRAVEEDLLRDGFLLRYRTRSGVDGLDGDESPFLACSFWLVEAYARTGRLEEAHALMRRLLAVRTDLGLLAEEYDPRTGRLLGNFPQAFSHLALVQAALALAEADGAAPG
ncbi:glycoside hydrolase family 15 protein [Phycicoccus endophyticus]|uniref:Glycoside hydrolase family 15 protein n=1 Tax=Phycicoccus endophyticus TaxID=1690220 RepID=A0A7G9R4C9_9MICO|nr:glycoside hydrolase family 15 protein [Phycicoccus endophyticus]NHI18323.1 glycoside hydrolase family 15 protein [Phycicoccus endophyticus]QNN50454.1 glycoside hydrolase family 15 protein [Phycicoccus endophyticus]GGL24666.1 glucoamylase [Phycicoccus endophyticus]